MDVGAKDWRRRHNHSWLRNGCVGLRGSTRPRLRPQRRPVGRAIRAAARRAKPPGNLVRVRVQAARTPIVIAVRRRDAGETKPRRVSDAVSGGSSLTRSGRVGESR